MPLSPWSLSSEMGTSRPLGSTSIVCASQDRQNGDFGRNARITGGIRAAASRIGKHCGTLRGEPLSRSEHRTQSEVSSVSYKGEYSDSSRSLSGVGIIAKNRSPRSVNPWTSPSNTSLRTSLQASRVILAIAA